MYPPDTLAARAALARLLSDGNMPAEQAGRVAATASLIAGTDDAALARLARSLLTQYGGTGARSYYRDLKQKVAAERGASDRTAVLDARLANGAGDPLAALDERIGNMRRT